MSMNDLHEHTDSCACGCGGEHEHTHEHEHVHGISCGCGGACDEHKTDNERKKEIYLILATAIIFVALILAPISSEILKFALFLIPYFMVGTPVLKRALAGIKSGSIFDENFLMAIATIGALCLGEATEAVAVMLFYRIGELFENYAIGQSQKSIENLMDIRPDYANLDIGSSTLRMSPENVKVGSAIVVKAGEKIPLDGIIIEGSSSLDTSALTGESLPRDVKVGDEAVSGCISLTGLIKIRTTKKYHDSTVARILSLVQESSEKKSKSETFITRFAKIYTPLVCYLALVLAFVPPIINVLIRNQAAEFTMWFTRALTFLVISCPCALVISIPLSFFGAIGLASRRGILVKGSVYMEALSNAKILATDKTGTLTYGKFSISNIYTAENVSAEEVLELCAYGEAWSNHPLALSVVAEYGKNIDKSRIKNHKELSGLGILCQLDGKDLSLGNYQMMKCDAIACKEIDSLGSIIYVAYNNKYMGAIELIDELKENSAAAIKELKSAGIGETVMLTGDAENIAKAIAEKVGLDSYYAKLLPKDKVDIIESLLAKKSEKEALIYIGDGINDAAALARADIGLSMGAMGSAAAIEAADIVIMDDDLSKISEAISISKRCMKIVHQNIVMILLVKAICLILGALGIANMWLAIFSDVGIMVLAVLNSMRMLVRD